MDPSERQRLLHRHLLDEADAEREHTRRELRRAYRDLVVAAVPLLLLYVALGVFKGWRDLLLALALTVVVCSVMGWRQARRERP